MERSLVIIKPDGMQRGLADTIINRLKQQGLKLIAEKTLKLEKPLVQKHYAPHRNKPFFNSLVAYITSAPVVVAVFEGEEAIALIRKVMGDTDPAKAGAGTIRGDFGLDIEQNTIHGSDSVETAHREIGLFFTDNEILNYQRGTGNRITES